jgi:hypothetical protein
MAFRKIFLFVNPDLAAPVPSDSPSTQIGLISKLPVYYFGETVIFCISLVDSQGNAVPYLNSDTFEMSVDNNFLHNDDLMAHTEGKADGTDDKVNVSGDWSDVSAANGKLSVRVDFNTVSYETKIGGSESIQVRTELKKFDAGSENPAILFQSLSTARNVVNGGEGEPEEADPNYLTAAQTRALAADEAGNLWKTGEGSPTYTNEKIGDMYLNTVNGAVYQVQNTSGGIEYTSVGNLTGPAGSPGSDGSQGPAGSAGATPVLSGGSVTTLPAGAPAAAALVSSGANTYYLNLDLPAGAPGSNGSNGSNGSDGISPTVSVTQLTSGARIVTSDAQGITSADVLNGSDGRLAAEIQQYDIGSSYAALTFLTYNGGGYQVLSATTAGENPDNASSKFLCFASRGADGSNGSNGSNGSDGSNGISPTVSVTQLTSGARIVTSDAQGEHSATILHGRLEGASEVVSSLTSGAIVLESEAVPVYVQTSAGTLYPVEKGTISISSGSWYIDPAAYLAYDGVSSFSGPWTVYYTGGLPDFQYIHGGSSSIIPLEHQVYQIPLSSGASVTVDSSGLNSSVCMTAELWLDMPSPAVPFTIPTFTWVDGAAPDFTSSSTRYAVTVRWNGTKFLANLAYTEDLA